VDERGTEVECWPAIEGDALGETEMSLGCCPSLLLESLVAAAANQLTNTRIFPDCDKSGIVIVKMGDLCLTLRDSCPDGNRLQVLKFGCRNELTSTSAFHLLHLLHHLNNCAFGFISRTSDPEAYGTFIEPTIFTTLASVYLVTGIHPPCFRLYTRALCQDTSPCSKPLLLESNKAQIHFSTLHYLDTFIEVVTPWIADSLCSLHMPIENAYDSGGVNLLDRMSSPFCHTVRFRLLYGHVKGEWVERLVAVSGF